jgi:hypothetical protein
MLSGVTSGKIKRPVLALIYGPGGIGKSTFASRAPKPIFLGPEQGTDNINTSRFPKPKTFEDMILAVDELTTKTHDFETLIIDTLDASEVLLHSMICKRWGVQNMELAAKGYGKAYSEAETEWSRFTEKLTNLRDTRQMNIILLAHPHCISQTNPQTGLSYNRFELKLHKKSVGVFTGWVDIMLFASYRTVDLKVGDAIQPMYSGERVLNTSWQHGFEAKNRFGLPESIPLSIGWKEFVGLCGDDEVKLPSLEEIHFNLDKQIALIKDEALKAKVVESVMTAGTDIAALQKYLIRVKELNGVSNVS